MNHFPWIVPNIQFLLTFPLEQRGQYTINGGRLKDHSSISPRSISAGAATPTLI